MLIVRLDHKAKNMRRPKGGNEINQSHSEKHCLIDIINNYLL
jgi:hypothetical protein